MYHRGGEGGIRTHGTLERTTVFETAPIDRSGTSPSGRLIGSQEMDRNQVDAGLPEDYIPRLPATGPVRPPHSYKKGDPRGR